MSTAARPSPARRPLRRLLAVAAVAAVAALPACDDGRAAEAAPDAPAAPEASVAPVAELPPQDPEVRGEDLVAAAALPPMTVYKSPTCGCCSAWVDHVREAGFEVTVHDVLDLGEIKRLQGIPPEVQSCHTAVVGRYVVEGHVPEDLVRRLLAEEPDLVGLAVPGMPVGSPGMEVGDQKDPYEVLALHPDGSTSVYARR